MGQILAPGASEARRAARKSQEALERQRNIEKAEAAELEDETARRKAVLAKGGARSSLLRTSETGLSGLAKNLGG